MKIQHSKSMAVHALTLALAMLGFASAAGAQTTNSTGVTNLSAPKPAVATPVSATSPAPIQAGVTQTPLPPAAATLTPPATNRVGDATNYLLALQASGQYASRNAYPVTSDVAQRTYQRYLDSFTYKIPESSETQVSSKSGSGR